MFLNINRADIHHNIYAVLQRGEINHERSDWSEVKR